MIVDLLLLSALLYTLVGIGIGVWFVGPALGRIDAGARGGGLALRAVLFPAAAVLWPISLRLILQRPIASGVHDVRVGDASAESRNWSSLRKMHVAAWIVLVPVLIAVLALAWSARVESSVIAPNHIGARP